MNFAVLVGGAAYLAWLSLPVLGAMLGPRVRVVETECEASGSDACRFSVTW